MRRSTNTSKNTYSIKMIKRSQNSVYASNNSESPVYTSMFKYNSTKRQIKHRNNPYTNLTYYLKLSINFASL